MSRVGLFMISALSVMTMRSHAARLQVIGTHDATGTECTRKEFDEFQQRFQIGKQYTSEAFPDGKRCSKEDEWGNDVEYSNPRSLNKVALYIYPADDHNGAFGICDGPKFDRLLCKRLHAQTEHYSVKFYRVNSVEQATEIIKRLPENMQIQHLVLGGHGDPTSLAWGNGKQGTPELSTEDEVTDQFLDAVNHHLTAGVQGSTVMLDACLNGKVIEDKNMVQHVAHRLAGTTVFGSSISWDNSEFELIRADHFQGRIISEKTKQNRMTQMKFGTGALRTWGFWPNEFCDDKASSAESRIGEIHECREACEKASSCKAFSWYPQGNKHSHKKCYLSNRCDETTASKNGAVTFEKPSS